MVKSRKPAKIKWNKKGAALAYTLIATMVLMILSTSLFTAAGYNISLTTKNDDARQSYITCKSAVEYAKSHILQKANDAQGYTGINTGNESENKMSSFSVELGATDSGFQINNTVSDPDGKTTFAKCETKLKAISKIAVQEVTTCTKNADNSYTVTAQSQTVTSTIKGVTLSLSDPNNWTIDKTEPTKDSVPKSTTTTIKMADIDPKPLGERYIFTYDIIITAKCQYTSSERTQQLNYAATCTIGGSDKPVTLTPSAVEVQTGAESPGIQMLAVGGQYGGNGNMVLVNSDSFGYSLKPGAESDMPVVFKREIRSSGNSGSISAPALYFMNGSSVTVSDTLPVPLNDTCSTIDGDFIYFNGNINGVVDTSNKRCSALRLKNTRNSLNLNKDYNVGVVQFNNTTIQLVSTSKDSNGVYPVTTKVLDGLYYFKNNTNLFDFSNLDSNLEAVPQADYSKISSIADQNYVNYLKSNINNIVSGEQGDSNPNDFAGWVGGGSLTNGKPSEQTGKTVYCYVNDCSNWVNIFNNYPNVPYKAKNIVFQLVNDTATLKVPQDKTATFQADYIMFSSKKGIEAENSFSKFIVKSVNGADPLTMAFPYDTVIQYYSGDTKVQYTITAGNYSAVPCGTNLFSVNAQNFFADPSHMTAYSTFTSTSQQTGIPSFLLYGAKYGGQQWWVYNNVNTPEFMENTNKRGNSAYPVLFNQPMQISSGNQDRILSAPQVYFMGTGNSIYGYSNGNAKICSDFIYIAGNITGENNSLLLTTSSGNSGIIYLKQCHISNRNTDYSADLSGYYSFKSGSDLFSLKGDINGNGNGSTNNLKKVKNQSEVNKIIRDNYVSYIEQQHGNIISCDTTIGGNAPTNAGTNWAPNGVLGATESGNFNGKDAYLYVNDASQWGSAAANYQASRINLQYVNTGSLTVPAHKEVTFTADNLSLNGQKTDVSQIGDKLVLQQGDVSSKFIVKTLDGTGRVTITLPHTLEVTDSRGKLYYSVNAGVYTVQSGTDLFAHPFSSGTTTITLDPFDFTPDVPKRIFTKGKYTNE